MRTDCYLPWDILQALQRDSSAPLVPGTEADRPRGWQGGGRGESLGGRGGKGGSQARQEGHVAIIPGEYSGEAGQVLPWLALNQHHQGLHTHR